MKINLIKSYEIRDSLYRYIYTKYLYPQLVKTTERDCKDIIKLVDKLVKEVIYVRDEKYLDKYYEKFNKIIELIAFKYSYCKNSELYAIINEILDIFTNYVDRKFIEIKDKFKNLVSYYLGSY